VIYTIIKKIAEYENTLDLSIHGKFMNKMHYIHTVLAL